ncbi:putative glycosyl transferase [Golovinomyces cichoracearum]|uniref:Putative glycosyl transferase n=1 Tax=Golovinomyces cichoracearum TaxID=62708 RepID=A0A420HY55_9PEZI|nr:putative glycosyl transferase [Golovinomyces cichoracearum]
MLPDAFSIMLRGRALQFYFTSCQNKNLTILEMFNLVKAQFEGQEYKDNLLTEWNNTSLRKLFLQHPEKPRTQVLKEMVEKLQQIQCGLNVEFQSIASLKNNIKTACASVPSCSSALLIPTDTLAELVSNLVAAISHDDIDNDDANIMFFELENEDNDDANIMFFELENDDETELEHEIPENFMTSTGKISASSARDYHRTLCDQSLLHRITQDEPSAYNFVESCWTQVQL